MIHADLMTVVTVGDLASMLKAVLEKAGFFYCLHKARRANS
jgi:hypothetical protein